LPIDQRSRVCAAGWRMVVVVRTDSGHAVPRARHGPDDSRKAAGASAPRGLSCAGRLRQRL